MNTEQYTYLLANPQKISEKDLTDLNELIEQYPYIQSARALQLKYLKDHNSFLYNDILKITAAYTTDRDILFEYITSEKFVQNDISQVILQHDDSAEDIVVISENISEQISLEIDNQIKAELKKAEAILNPGLFERKLESIAEIAEHDVSEEKIETSEVSENNIENPKEILGIDQPLEFTKKDTHSFGEWLQLTRTKVIDRTETPKEQLDKIETSDTIKAIKVKKFEMIEKFIQEKPKLEPKSFTSVNKNLAAPFNQTPDSLMTETLAKVYLQQKNYSKAIKAYKILILKNPEKSGFFADQIRAIEKLTNTE